MRTDTLDRARDLTSFTGNIWDPEDDEWAEADANRVVETSKDSYKSFTHFSLTKANTLFGLGSSVPSLLPSSPIRTVTVQDLREEEKRRDYLELLTKPCYCDPNGDLEDEIMKQVFVEGSSFFTARLGNSPRHMHIINLDEYFQVDDPLLQQAKPRLCDTVATILSHTNNRCLEDFLNPAIDEFIYRCELGQNKTGPSLVIRRQGNTVIAGTFRNFGFTLQWNLYVKALISVTGQWHEVYATLQPGSTSIVNGVPEWTIFEPENFNPKTERSDSKPENGSLRKIELTSLEKTKKKDNGLSGRDPKLLLYQSRILAKDLLRNIWIRFSGLSVHWASWEADGVVSQVRLKRALVGFGECEEEG